jgi:hypothetical protein
MNNPSPTRAQLHTEAVAERALTEHHASVAAFHKLVARFLDDLRRLHFPLGSPSKHYDVADIEAFLTDTLKPRDPDRLEQAAMDLANEKEVV